MSSNFCWPWWYRQKNRTTVSSAMLYLSRVETRGETRVKMVKRRAAGREREEFGVGMGKTSQIAGTDISCTIIFIEGHKHKSHSNMKYIM